MLTATKSSRINISDEEKTKLVANKLSKHLKAGDVLLLNGELGVGKTTFVKYLINFLQKNSNQKITEITSPTFNIINEYYLESLVIKHCDLYRINDEKELENLDIFENVKKQITLIEWPEIIKKYKINNKLEIFFQYDQNFNNRFITFSSSKKNTFLNEIS